MARQLISSDSPWESRLGYSRAVRVGPHVFVTATCAVDEEGRNYGVGDAGAQTRRILQIIEHALMDAGSSLSDVVRTRVFLVNIDDREVVGRIHGDVFAEIRPASFMCQVTRFIDPEWLVEIEVDAIIEANA